MNKEKLEYYEELLQKEKKKRLESLYDKSIGYRSSIANSTGELSTYENHPADMGTETFEAEKNLSFLNNDRYVLDEIDSALQKIKTEEYGLCEGCKNDINAERLEVLPYARYCIECEEKLEKENISYENGRPIEESLLYPPFGRSSSLLQNPKFIKI